MNYEKLYLRLCSSFQKSTPIERLTKRSKDDHRLNKEKLYTEHHHILPRSLGGTDDNVNMVEVLPEEHLILHKIRYKAYGDIQDMLAIKFMIGGFIGRSNDVSYTRKFLCVYGWYRQKCYEGRVFVGWMPEESRNRISESRKKKIPGRCVKTGKILGEFYTDDPRVVSGEIVHHSKGRNTYKCPKTGEKIYCLVNEKPDGYVSITSGTQIGEKNNRYSGITDEEIFDFVDKLCSVIIDHNIKIFPPYTFISKIWKIINGTTFPHLIGGERSGFRFNGNIKQNLHIPLCKKYGMEYQKYSKIYRKISIDEVINDYNRIFG